MRTAASLRWLSAAIATFIASQLHAASGEQEPLPDTEITRAVEEEILFDDAVPYNDIDVFTVGGVVSLEGETESALAKQRATLLAETVRGVRAVTNRINVIRDAALTPERIESSVKDALLYDPVADAYEILVTAEKDGSVELTGNVDSWHESQLAEQVALGVKGVTSVENNIVIAYKLERPDAEVEREIESMLAWNTLVDEALIDVSVIDEVAHLSGVVGSSAEKRQAKSIAWVGGIDQVDTSELRVESWFKDSDLRERKSVNNSDSDIAEAIDHAMAYDPRVISAKVNPMVNDAWVTLRGAVDNVLSKEAAESIARNTLGVTGVNNMIKIRSSDPVDSEILAKVVDAKLDRDPWVSTGSVEATAKNGVVRLTGIVDTIFEKARAETLAQSARGTKEIKNYVKVMDQDSVVVYDPYLWGYAPTPWSYYDQTSTPRTDIFASSTDDKRTAKEIADEIYWSPYVSLEDVTIAVNDGVATLVGEVETQKEKDAATENAIEGGARSVINQIVVSG
ncbi:BON domain-containing protein [Pelagicoccus sp. SDUM812002]|nr:BON domain-containing protein [Pelagicoccus sp. SDUM812002]